MHIIWENLTAMILLLGITVTLLAVNANNQEMLAESTAYYMLRNDGIAFMDLIKRDLKGAEKVKSYSAQSGSFSFDTYIGEETSASSIEYRRKEVGQVQHSRAGGDGATVETITLYQIERYVDGNLTGGSPASVSDFQMQALNEQNNPIESGSDLESCRKIFVHFEIASPYVDIEAIDRMRWETTYIPPMLEESSIL